MAAITENSIAQITLPVGTTAQFDAHKVAGFTGWNTDLGALVACPGDGADFVAVGGSGISTIRSYAGYVTDMTHTGADAHVFDEFTIPAGVFPAHKQVRIRVQGMINPATTSSTLQIRAGSSTGAILHQATWDASDYATNGGWFDVEMLLVSPDSTHLNPIISEVLGDSGYVKPQKRRTGIIEYANVGDVSLAIPVVVMCDNAGASDMLSITSILATVA